MGKSNSYKSPKGTLPSVKYWDKAFNKSSAWMSWLALKESLAVRVQDVMDEEGCNESEAMETLWNSIDAILNGDYDSPTWDLYEDFISSNDDDILLYLTLHLAIGSYIHAGHSEAQAKKLWKQDAVDDPDVLEGWGYRVTKDLKVVKK